jgi:hypothetical protein
MKKKIIKKWYNKGQKKTFLFVLLFFQKSHFEWFIEPLYFHKWEFWLHNKNKLTEKYVTGAACNIIFIFGFLYNRKWGWRNVCSKCNQTSCNIIRIGKKRNRFLKNVKILKIIFKYFFWWIVLNRSNAIGFDLAETFTRPALECSDHVFIKKKFPRFLRNSLLKGVRPFWGRLV